MKKNTYKLLAVLLLFSITSCKKYLGTNPDMRAEIDNTNKLAALVTSAYPHYNYLAMAETYSDNVSDKGPAASGTHVNEPYVSLYNWADVQDDGNNTPTQYWNGVYEGIAAANQAIASFNEYKMGADALPYKGEALVARAYGHFMLVTFFAKAYQPGAANDSPGIPYVLEPETIPIKQYSRGTVASVYAQIQKDLEEGLPLLKNGKWDVPKYHFTYPAANAFAARFYLFKGDWAKVVQSANEIFAGGDFTGNLRNYNAVIRNYTTEEYRTAFTMADKNYNLLLHETYSVYQRSSSAAQSRYGFSTDRFQKIYTATTPTGTPFITRGLTFGTGNYTMYIFKEYFHYTNVQAGIGFPYIMQPLFVADEALINRAEAYVQQGNFDAALADINQFASVRVLNYNATNNAVTLAKAKAFYNVTDDKEALLKTILQFKQIGFMGEGMRWFDILRHRIPVIHNKIADDGTETFVTLGPDDNRRMFQIPVSAKISGIEPNPR